MEELNFLQSAENFENVCEMFQENIRYLKNAIKRYPHRFIMKSERDEGSSNISFYVCSITISIFTKFSGEPYYEPLVWLMMYPTYQQ